MERRAFLREKEKELSTLKQARMDKRQKAFTQE